jgi:hypothetical protein
MAISTDDAIRFGFLLHDVSRLRRVVIDRELKPLGVTRRNGGCFVTSRAVTG